VSTHKRISALITAGVSATLIVGVVTNTEAAPTPAVSPAAVIASENSAAFAHEAQALAGIHEAVAQQRAAASAAQAAANRAAQIVALRESAVRIALSRKGMSYSAGASGPRAFDCSGFTRYVWRTAGKNIARTSWDQFATLPKVSRSQARPGDLVFFFGSGAHHVAFYLGNNKIIHAANYGTGVVITNLSQNWYASRLSGFRRVV